MKVSMTVNGVAVSHDVEPRTLLVQYPARKSWTNRYPRWL